MTAAPDRAPGLARLPFLIAGFVLAPFQGGAAGNSHSLEDTGLGTRVLAAAPEGTPAEARAIWIDGRRLRWSGQPPLASGERFVLVSRSLGAEAPLSAPLDLDPDPLDPATAARVRWAGEGPVLRVGDSEAPLVPAMLRGHVVVERRDASDRVVAATRTQLAGALDALYADAALAPDLGIVAARGSTRFTLWAPTARRVSVVHYPTADGPASDILAMTRDDRTGIWTAEVEQDLSGHYATYLVDVVNTRGELRRQEVTDPYALSLTTDSRRAMILDLDDPRSKPEGWDAHPRPAPLASATDQVIYELHVRDFSLADPLVPEAHRGKYLAFAAPDSHGTRHLRALAEAGVTDIHLLPAYDIATVPDVGALHPAIPADAGPASEAQQAAVAEVAARDAFNWGYDPFHYTAPEGSYATDPADGWVRVREFRAMVMALHGMGLRVGMDVVYNHTFASGDDPKSVLDRIVPGYYHRMDATGKVETSTCCDNTATEHRMMAKLMIESAATWVRHHRIDSFRFDLMGHQPREAMEELQARVNAAAGRHVHLLGEGWNFGEVADGARFVQASQLSLGGSGIATFSDRARDSARGGGFGDRGDDVIRRQGWLSGLHYAPNELGGGATREELHRASDMLRLGIAGSLRDFRLQLHDGRVVALSELGYGNQPAGYVHQPGEVVNYVENHDNQTLFDSNALKLPPDTSPEDRARAQVLGTALVAFSQGIAYLHAGQEILRSKSMDRNSYDSGDWFNLLDYTYRDNGFARGLPPRRDNLPYWPQMASRLADPRIKPTSAEIRFALGASLDLLRIRSSTTLFRLRRSEDVVERLRFHNTGPGSEPAVIALELDGHGYPGAAFNSVVAFVNADIRPHALLLAPLAGQAYALHPVHLAPEAADPRPARDARQDPATGTFTVPPRTAVVWVR